MNQAPLRRQHASDVLHCGRQVVQVLQHVACERDVRYPVAERQVWRVETRHHIHAREGDDVQAEGAGGLVPATAQIDVDNPVR